MPLQRWKSAIPVALALLAGLGAVTPAHALRFMTWNIAKYPNVSPATQDPNFRTVFIQANADVLAAQELNTSQGATDFLNNVLNVAEPGQWALAAWQSLQGSPLEGGAVFYKPAKVSVTDISTTNDGGPRLVYRCIVKPVGYTSIQSWVRLYSVHFKAGGPATTDSTTRRTEGTLLRNAVNLINTGLFGPNFLICGDTNIYGAYEGCYQRLTENQADNDGRCKDPLVGTAPGIGGISANWHTNSNFALWDSQSPCFDATDCLGGAGGFTSGGMDDRFDLMLAAYSLFDGTGLEYVPAPNVFDGSYPYQFANDGQHFNQRIDGGGFNNAVPFAVAQALHGASDHVPTLITIAVPAKVSAPAALAFGSAIVGSAPTQTLPVSNTAVSPADPLSYTLTAPAGFTAPGGAFEEGAGSPAANHTVGMSTASTGVLGGTLTINSDDVDAPTFNVALSGTVVDHAASSLDSAIVTTGALVDFGAHPAGGFSDQSVRAHDFGYDALQARLAMGAANIVGGDGRFSIVGGFTPSLLAGTGQTYNLHFNETGATLDLDYNATLTFSTADEPIPGATAQTDLVVNLHAKPTTGTTGVDPGQAPPTALQFYPPHPNPLARDAVFAFDLPTEAPVSLAVFDLGGRRVSTVVSGTQSAARHQLTWQAVGDDGTPLHAGLYFARFVTPGLSRTMRLVVLQ
jgi:exonuclease III